ncbi:hypothetical protein M8J77_000038 [Diaphorina citri]|nr:hypothetical protein M8J77_000038 [Diaphorina citri]
MTSSPTYNRESMMMNYQLFCILSGLFINSSDTDISSFETNGCTGVKLCLHIVDELLLDLVSVTTSRGIYFSKLNISRVYSCTPLYVCVMVSLCIDGEARGFTLVKVKGDGACLFNALSMGMSGTEVHAHAIRSDIVAHVLNVACPLSP